MNWLFPSTSDPHHQKIPQKRGNKSIKPSDNINKRSQTEQNHKREKNTCARYETIYIIVYKVNPYLSQVEALTKWDDLHITQTERAEEKVGTARKVPASRNRKKK